LTAEAVAFYKGERREEAGAGERLMQLVVASRVRILWSSALTLWTHYYRRGRVRAWQPRAAPAGRRAWGLRLRLAGEALERDVAGTPAGVPRASSARSLAVQGRGGQARVWIFTCMRTACSA